MMTKLSHTFLGATKEQGSTIMFQCFRANSRACYSDSLTVSDDIDIEHISQYFSRIWHRPSGVEIHTMKNGIA